MLLAYLFAVENYGFRGAAPVRLELLALSRNSGFPLRRNNAHGWILRQKPPYRSLPAAFPRFGAGKCCARILCMREAACICCANQNSGLILPMPCGLPVECGGGPPVARRHMSYTCFYNCNLFCRKNQVGGGKFSRWGGKFSARSRFCGMGLVKCTKNAGANLVQFTKIRPGGAGCLTFLSPSGIIETDR